MIIPGWWDHTIHWTTSVRLIVRNDLWLKYETGKRHKSVTILKGPIRVDTEIDQSRVAEPQECLQISINIARF